MEWPPSYSEAPDTPVILDLLELCARAVGLPVEGDFHPFFGHPSASTGQLISVGMRNLDRVPPPDVGAIRVADRSTYSTPTEDFECPNSSPA